ncbi:MAG TPA: hypothetical protein VK131_03045 [Candidatus Acidoferrales bacterium]|nr:hypothetical protein [Candidatus Acidoferrales bacterium]
MPQADDRRLTLRRLDDILEALEQMNLREEKTLDEPLLRRLLELGLEDPGRFTVPQLIEKVWGMQQPFLITVSVERRRRRRRQTDAGVIAAS